MIKGHTDESWVAVLWQQIACKYVATKVGFSRLAQGIATHAWIREKPKRVAAAMIGNEQAMELMWTRIFASNGGEKDHQAVATPTTNGHIWEQTLRQTEIDQAECPSLRLAGRTIHEGDRLSLRIFDTWVAGEVRQDRTGWYLLTAAQAGIRLSPGLTAQWGGRSQEQTIEEQNEK